MMTDHLTDEDKRHLSRTRWLFLPACIILLAIGGVGAWYGGAELQRRYGMEAHASIWIAAIVLTAPFLVLFPLAAKLGFRRQSRLSPQFRRMQSEKARISERRWRPLWVFWLLCSGLPYLLDLLNPTLASKPEGHGWSLLPIAAAFSGILASLPKDGSSVDEILGMRRQDAIRKGYVVMIALGIPLAIAQGYWPLLAARCWPLVLFAGMLVPQVRLMTLDWFSAPPE